MTPSAPGPLPGWIVWSWRCSLVATVLIGIGMGVINSRLQTERAPAGIVSLQMTGDLNQASQIVHAWDKSAQTWAIYGLLLDFPFMLAYGALLWSGCCETAWKFSPTSGAQQRKWLWIATAIPWIAVLLDAVENVIHFYLIALADGEPFPPFPASYLHVAHLSALTKFALLGVSLLLALPGFFKHGFAPSPGIR